MAETEPDLPPAVVALQQMLLLVIGSLRAALDAAEEAVRDPETVRAATQVLAGMAGMAAPLLADFAAFARSGPPAAAPSAPSTGTTNPAGTTNPGDATKPTDASSSAGGSADQVPAAPVPVADASARDAGHRAA